MKKGIYTLFLAFCMLFLAVPVSAATVDKNNFHFSDMYLKRVWFQNMDPIFKIDHYEPVELAEGLNITGIGNLSNVTAGGASDGFLAPMKEFFYQIGGTYEESGNTVTMSLNGDTLVMTVGSTDVKLNGKSLDALPEASKPQSINISEHPVFGPVNPLVTSDVEIIYLPVRYILDAFQAAIYWDGGQSSMYAVVKVLRNESDTIPDPDKQGSRLDQILSLNIIENKENAKKIANNIVALQNTDGGFMNLAEDVDMAQDQLVSKIGIKRNSSIVEIANGQVSTVTELRFLAKMIESYPNEAVLYTSAFDKGIQYLLDAQLDNGGWALQKDGIGYYSPIAFADNAMVSVLTLFNDIARLNDQDFTFFRKDNQDVVSLIDEALEKGINCLVKMQIAVNDNLTGWSSHHHPIDLVPVIGKTHEREGINAAESTRIAEFLMSVRKPSDKVKMAIESAVSWLEGVKINDKKMETVTDITMNNGIERYLVDKADHVTWARNYKVSGTSFDPFFSDRQLERGDIPLMNFDRNDPRDVIGTPAANKYYSNYNVASGATPKIMFYETRTEFEWYVETPRKIIETDYVKWKNYLEIGWPALPGDPEEPQHITLVVDKESLELAKDQNASLIVKQVTTVDGVVTEENDVTELADYTDYDDKVVTVSKGNVVAVGEGTTTITITYGGVTVEVVVIVTEDGENPDPVPVLSVSPTTLSLKVGDEQPLVVTDKEEQVVTEGVTYASTDEEVATVSGEGNVVAIGVGIATITVSYEDETVEVKVTVTEDGENPGPDPEVVVAISVDKESLALEFGKDSQLKVTQTTTTDGNATVKDVTKEATYEVTHGNIVSVVEGLVTAKAKGTTEITISYEGEVAIVSVTVTDPVVVNPAPVDPKPETPSEPSKPTPPTPPVDSGKVVVDDKKVADQVNDPKTTKIEVIAPAPTEAKPDVKAEVSAEIMKTIAQSGKALVVKAGAIEVSVPSEVLKAISQATSGKVTFNVGLAKDTKAPGDGTTLSSVYEFSISAEKDGKTSNVATFSKPVSVSIPVDAKAVKDSRKVAAYYVNEAKNTLEYVDGKYTNGKVDFKTNHFSKFVVVENNKTFKDIQSGGIKWVKDYVEVLASKSIIQGKSEDTFAPSDQITRAQFALLLSRALDLPKQAYEGTFSDVTEKMDGSVLEIEAANRAGIVTGNNGKFQPNELITRQQMAAMIIRAIEYKDASILEGVNSKVLFADAANVADYAKEYVGLAAELGIIGGKEVNGKNVFAPKENATRAHAAKMLYNLLEKF